MVKGYAAAISDSTLGILEYALTFPHAAEMT